MQVCIIGVLKCVTVTISFHDFKMCHSLEAKIIHLLGEWIWINFTAWLFSSIDNRIFDRCLFLYSGYIELGRDPNRLELEWVEKKSVAVMVWEDIDACVFVLTSARMTFDWNSVGRFWLHHLLWRYFVQIHGASHIQPVPWKDHK